MYQNVLRKKSITIGTILGFHIVQCFSYLEMRNLWSIAQFICSLVLDIAII